MKVPVLINTPRNATFREISGKGLALPFRFSSFGVEQQVETTPDKPLAVERHVVRLHAGSSMSFLLPASRTSFEGHSIQTTTSPSSALTVHFEVGDLAVRQVVALPWFLLD